MESMLVTFAVLKPDSGWLKAAAPRNILFMLVTSAVLNPDSGWLKAFAPQNMPSMLVTFAVSHPDRSGLTGNAGVILHAFWPKRLNIKVTSETSQSLIGPYLRSEAVALAQYSPTAVLRLPSVKEVAETLGAARAINRKSTGKQEENFIVLSKYKA